MECVPNFTAAGAFFVTVRGHFLPDYAAAEASPAE